MLEDLAVLAAKSIEQEANKWLEKQRAQGVSEPVKMSGEEKKKMAVEAMKSLAPPELKLSDKQASVAIEAVVQKVKSLRPPPMSVDPTETTYQSIRPGGM